MKVKNNENEGELLKEKMPAISDRVWPLVSLSFLWPLLRTGLKEPLNASHLLPFEPHLTTKVLSRRLELYWSELRVYLKDPMSHKKPSLLWHLFRIMWKRMFCLGVASFFGQVGQIASPILLSLFLSSFTDAREKSYQTALGIALVIAPMFATAALTLDSTLGYLSMMILNGILSDSVMTKIFKSEKFRINEGEIVGMQQQHVPIIASFFGQSITLGTVAIISIVIRLVALYFFVGIYVVFGIAAYFLVQIPIGKLAAYIGTFRVKTRDQVIQR